MQSLAFSTFKKAQSMGAAAATAVVQKAGAAKDFVVEAAQIASLKVSGHLLGTSEDPFLDLGDAIQGDFCIEVVKAKNVPRCDLFSPSDPFVQCYISVKQDEKIYRVSKISTTSIRQDTEEPIWHYFTNLKCNPPDSSFLSINLYDADFDDNAVLKTRTLLGSAQIPIADLAHDDLRSYPLELELQKLSKKENISDFSIYLRRIFREKPPPNRKTFFIIRHGESKWNQAEDDKNIPALIAFDHPLTAKGIAQVTTRQLMSLCYEVENDSFSSGGFTLRQVD
jgi:Ca2+-dependent lipid-binding protein